MAVENAGFSNRYLGKKIGVSESTVGRWLLGKQEPTAEPVKQALASALGVRYEWLFDDAYDGPANPEDKRRNSVVSLVCEGKPHYESRPPDDFSEAEERYINDVLCILRSRAVETIEALASNIRQFRKQVDQIEHIQELERRVAELERNTQNTRARGPGSIGPDANTHDIRVKRKKNNNHDL